MPPHPERDDEPVVDRSAESMAPLAAESTGSKPAASKAAASKPAVRKPAVRKPAVRKPAVPKPAAVKSADTQAVPDEDAGKPAVRKPAVRKPAVPKPAAVKSADTQAVPDEGAGKPAVRKPAVRKPAAVKSADTQAVPDEGAGKPAVRKPAVRTSTTPRKLTAPKLPDVAPSTRATEQTLAENATDETTRPYATRDALVASETEQPLGTPVTPLPEPSMDPRPREMPGNTTPRISEPAAKAVISPAVKSAKKPAVVEAPIVIAARGLAKRFGHNVAVSDLDLTVRAGSFYGIVGPNGAGKTTTLSMITGLLRPSAGNVTVHGIDVWARPNDAKRVMGVLPDRLRLFDRLTGAQLLYYAGTLRGLDNDTVRSRSADLAMAFGLEDALNRLVADYSAGMTKKIALACAMIHSPRVLVLDEPFESVDPVSAVNVTEILQKYVAAGGTVVLSSHGMDLIQRVCDHVAIIVQGRVLAAGTIDEVRGPKSLEDRFVALAGGRKVAEGMEWLHNFSD